MVRGMTSNGVPRSSATLHCLTGCAIGEVLGMVIGTALGWTTVPTVILSVALAFLFGYALTMRPVLRAGVSFRAAVPVALAADTLSIAVMELVDNAFIVAIPGAMDAGVASLLFWGTLAASLAIAFVVTVPVNKWTIARGQGHAVVQTTRAPTRVGSWLSWCTTGPRTASRRSRWTPRTTATRCPRSCAASCGTTWAPR